MTEKPQIRVERTIEMMAKYSSQFGFVLRNFYYFCMCFAFPKNDFDNKLVCLCVVGGMDWEEDSKRNLLDSTGMIFG